MTSFQAPKGTFDLLPPDSATFLAVREAMATSAQRAGYAYVETPTFEDTALFERGVGESTDVVEQGDVHLRRQGRPVADPAPRGHRRGAAGSAGAQPAPRRPAGEGLVLRQLLPLRAAAGGALPALLPGRVSRRSAPRTRRSTPRPSSSPSTPTPASACATSGCCSTRWATASAARRTARRCRTSSAASTSTRRPVAVSRSTRSGSWTTSARRCAPSSAAHPWRSTTCATRARATTSRCARC